MVMILWIPVVILQYLLIGFLTYKNNTSGGWVAALWLAGAIPLWPLISRFSRDVVFDGLVFDVCMTVTYTLSVMFFTKAFYKFGLEQYMGLALILFGLFFFKRGI